MARKTLSVSAKKLRPGEKQARPVTQAACFLVYCESESFFAVVSDFALDFSGAVFFALAVVESTGRASFCFGLGASWAAILSLPFPATESFKGDSVVCVGTDESFNVSAAEPVGVVVSVCDGFTGAAGFPMLTLAPGVPHRA